MFSLSGKTALVTGAATGLGQAIAVALARNGTRVAITDRNMESLQETQSLIAGISGPNGLAIDVRDIPAISAFDRSSKRSAKSTSW